MLQLPVRAFGSEEMVSGCENHSKDVISHIAVT